MTCPICGSDHVGYDDTAIRVCMEHDCDWTELRDVTAERDAALAELAALKKRLADSPIGAVEVYEAQRYVGGKRVAVKLPESFEHGAVVRVVRVLTEDKK